jgi:hypothetical protein
MASMEYLRSFWWLVATVPLFGILALAFGYGPLQAIGMFALLWPFSIPARSVLSTRKASKLFSKGCRLVAYDDRLEFQGETPGPAGKPLRMVVPTDGVRDVVRRGENLLIRTLRFGFVPVPVSAFGDEGEAEAFAASFARS